MYKSPIELIISDVNFKFREEQERQIYEAVRRVGVNVDKDELIRALNYDRQQYEKGYADGIREFAEFCKKCLPTITVFDYLVKEMEGEG